MMDPRPKTEQPKEQSAPGVARGPSTTAAPAKPVVATPKDPARIPTQAKP